MEILDLQLLPLAIALLVPGFVAVKVYDLLVPGERRDWTASILDALTLRPECLQLQFSLRLEGLMGQTNRNRGRSSDGRAYVPLKKGYQPEPSDLVPEPPQGGSALLPYESLHPAGSSDSTGDSAETGDRTPDSNG